MTPDLDPPRHVLSITGQDRVHFLQGLVSNDVGKLSDGLVYAALLSPQGKYLADFFLVPDSDAILLDVAEPLAAGLVQRLTLYKLRADVQIAASDLTVSRGLGDIPTGAFADPRDPGMGWRCYDGSAPDQAVDWVATRVALGVPETGVELIPNDSYILEMGFQRLNGVDFRKGCYVGQEVTARMHHKTELKKGLCRVALDGPAASGTEIVAAGKAAGMLHSVAGDRALAYLRFDRADGPMQAGAATVRRLDPA